jgi:glyoxylase-like metal-dependent hydrolase (beta-lactamase superfamily II)
MNHEPYASLKVREFRWYLLARMCLTMAWQMQGVIVGWQVYSFTKDPFALGLVGLAEAIPFIITSFYGGHTADVVERKKIIIPFTALYLICALCLLSFTFPFAHVVYQNHVWPIYGIIAATAVETPDGLALFDTGPESTFAHLAEQLSEAGFAAENVRHVFLSHIHFDHAGAAWRFAELGATIYVHPRGAPHLIDPAKLVASATRLYGDDMERLWGKFSGIAPDRVRILEDNDVVRVAPFEIRAIATPGHASHHHIYHWGDIVFGGDVAGVRLGGGPPAPPFVPPELDIEAWRESIAKIRALNPEKLYLPHFGLVPGDIAAHLDALEERVSRWSTWFRDRIRAGDDEQKMKPAFADYVTTDLRAAGATEIEVAAYEQADPSFMAVNAALRYWRKHHPEEVGLSGAA